MRHTRPTPKGSGGKGGNSDSGGIRSVGGSNDKRGSKGKVPHDSSPMSSGRLSKGPQLSPAFSGSGRKRIGNPAIDVSRMSTDLHEPNLMKGQQILNTIEDQESESDADGDTEDDFVGRGSNVMITPPANPSHRIPVKLLSKGFEEPSVHRQITGIMSQFLSRPWPTWKQVPKNVRESMFERFRGLYQWPDTEEDVVFEAFQSILKRRFRDVIKDARDSSILAAKNAGNVFPSETMDFLLMRDFPPSWIDLDVWQDLCAIWNTDAWKKKSESAKRNRKQ